MAVTDPMRRSSTFRCYVLVADAYTPTSLKHTYGLKYVRELPFTEHSKSQMNGKVVREYYSVLYNMWGLVRPWEV